MPLKTEDPQTQETYLCVVSEWQGGKNSGNCYPVFVLSKGRILKEPDSQFPNAGAVFLPSRRGKVFDLISLRPVLNPTYKDQNYRDCYFVPLVNSIHYPTREELLGVHTVLAVPSFDPDVRQIPHPAQLVTPVFFVRDLSKGGRLIGPLRCVEVRRSSLGETVEWIAWRAESDEGLAWTFPESALGSNGLKLEVYQHPRPDLNDILARPFEFLVGKLGEGIAGGEPLDLAAAEDLVRFYQRVGGIAIPQELTSALASIPSREGTERPAYLRSRFDRLRRLLTNAAQLEDERRRIAGEFLKTEQGKLQVSALIAQAKEEARVAVRTELNVEGERRRLQAELDALAARKAALEAELAAEKGRREKDLESLESTISELKGAAGLEAESLRKRVFEALPGLVAISAGAAAPEARAPSSEAAEDRAQRSSGVEIRPLPAPRPFRQVEDEALYVRWLRDELARTGLHFSYEMVANVFACMKCSPLTLIGGPPGVGKSSLVRALPVLLGQEHCFLELSVRRTWADDRALLGFPDVFHGRYEPGTTGFVPHLVRAMRDAETKAGGIYVVLLDEFNLAPPEYYFSEFLRILQKAPDERSLRLYTPSPGMEGDPIPPELFVGPNVSFWGTVNLDETTEPLSPRLLDRVHFIVVSAEDVAAPAERPKERPAGQPGLGPYSFEQLARSRAEAAAPNPEAWDLVERTLAVLRREHQDWGPPIAFHPRQTKEIERYLAAARPVLAATGAADLVINQRVLPGLRGRGEAFRRRMEAFHDHLAAASLRRCASRLERILRHAEENYDAFDFHVY